ncbi:MAG TPA: helix-turn-helix domain-containing protein [Halanaerobiales bacterium]|nr:helix-turn-helix domain-containing protein [Halanaerobiales bacterium]
MGKKKGKTKEVVDALLVLNEMNGNLSQAAARLNMSKATLMRWRNSYDPEKRKEIKEIKKAARPKKPKKLFDKEAEEAVVEYTSNKAKQSVKLIQERDKWLDVLKMFREQLDETNILEQDIRKLADVYKILHESATGESLDKDNNKSNNFWTVINNQILNQQKDERDD